MTDSIAIADIIQSVGDGLREAEARSAGKAKVLQLAECEVELAVRATTDVNGGLRFWIIEAGGGHSREDTSHIKLKFSPVGIRQFVALGNAGDAASPPDRQTPEPMGEQAADAL